MTTVFDKAIARLREDPEADEAYRQQVARVELAKMLREWRKGAGLTQAELAKRMGTSQSVIARMESFDNDHMPQLGTLIAFAHHCGRNLLLGSSLRDAEAQGRDAAQPVNHLVAM
jgi:transcriptional regulator with XRE-family HTH domain